jgi:type I restriction enzyme, R subunit
VVPALHSAGWQADRIVEQRTFTDGRVIPVGHGHKRGRRRRADYLLELERGQPLAVVEAKRSHKLPDDGLQQAMTYAEMLGAGFAYATNGTGIVEHDFATGAQRHTTTFPSPEELWERHLAWRGIEPSRAAPLALPFNRELRVGGSVKEPRYYQAIAINRVVEGVVAGRRRLLLTMATGTGKTFVALQILWKLWSGSWPGKRKPRVLYLADRRILIDQPIAREFQPVFDEAIGRIRGRKRTSRDVYFALYQALGVGESDDRSGVFRDYAPDFFDLVIVDECHRGSARDESQWRAVLEHFAGAVQLGLTATPLREENADTYEYFGEPVYQYSLAQGIEDGFLAPYQVTRVTLSADAEGWRPSPGQLDRFGRDVPDKLYTTPEFERVVSLLERTRLAARHLTNHLRRTDRFAKTIVFCVDVEHAAQMRQALHDANRDLTRQHPHYAARIVGDEGDFGVELLGRFADPEEETPVIVTTSKLLSTGVDVPTCQNIVLFRPIGSMVEFKQIVGRGTRLAPDHDKLWFQIVDYAEATRLFEDPAFDGEPINVERQVIDAAGEPITDDVVSEPEIPYDPEPPATDDHLLQDAPPRKLYVDDAEVHLAAESVRIVDPVSGSLRTIRYEEYAARTVRRLFPQPDDLRGRWRSAPGRDEVEQALQQRGIELGELASRCGVAADVDAFDLLLHLAWSTPLTTRAQRVRRVKREDAEFMASFRPEARAILELLLEKYAEHGIRELDDLAVLRVTPVAELGSVVEIAERFGGADDLQRALEDLAERLYAA